MNFRKQRKDAGIPRKPKAFEDEIIAAKLNRGNDDERRALELWDAWLAQNYSKRQLLTWVTLKAAGEELPSSPETTRSGLRDVIAQFQHQLDALADTVAQLQELGVAPASVKKRGGSKAKVDTSYLQNLMKAFQGDEE